MCLILFSYRPDSNRPLVVAANRDEVHERASQAAMFWDCLLYTSDAADE